MYLSSVLLRISSVACAKMDGTHSSWKSHSFWRTQKDSRALTNFLWVWDWRTESGSPMTCVPFPWSLVSWGFFFFFLIVSYLFFNIFYVLTLQLQVKDEPQIFNESFYHKGLSGHSKISSEEPQAPRYIVIPWFFLQTSSLSSLKSKHIVLVFERASDSHLECFLMEPLIYIKSSYNIR